MKRTLRRLRGILGIGLVWAAAWGSLGAAYGVVLGILNPRYWSVGNPLTDTAFGLGIAGLIAGTGFGSLLSWLDRTKTLQGLSYLRVAAWGAAGGALVPVLVHLTRGLTSSAGWGYVGLVALVTGGLGFISAIGTLRIARIEFRRGSAEETDVEETEVELLSEPVPDWGGSIVDEPASRRSAKTPLDVDGRDA